MRSLEQADIRKQNIRRMLHLLTGRAPCTRQSLADETGLSLMTVSNLVDQLRAHGVLRLSVAQRGDTPPRAAGRKAESISLNGESHAWLIVDLSGLQFSYTLLSFDLAVLLTGSAPSGQDYAAQLRQFLCDVRGRIAPQLAHRQLLGVAVVTPGPYEIDTDKVHNQRLPQINELHIKEECRRHLGDYEYYVDEDVKFAVRAFIPRIERESCEMLYYLFIGEGVGGAAVHNMNMIRGLNATAGDPGQLPAPGGGTYESRLSLSAFAARLGCGEDEIAHAAARHPAAYRKALEAAADETAAMLESVLWVLDPCRVIIDCRYAVPHEKTFISRIVHTLSTRRADPGRILPQFSPAPQGMSSIQRGAVQVLLREWVERSWC